MQTGRLIEAQERQPTRIPITEVLDAEGRVEVFPEILGKGYVDIDFRRSELVVVAGSHIGQIPLNKRITLDIKPKLEIADFVHVVGRAELDIRFIDFYERWYGAAAKAAPNVFEFLVACLEQELRNLIEKGAHREFVQIAEDTSFPRGRFDFERTIRNNFARGRLDRVWTKRFSLEMDNAYNRLIKYAVWYCLNHLVSIGSQRVDLIKSLTETYRLFDAVPLDRSLEYCDYVAKSLQDGRVPLIREYYRSICHICLTLVSDLAVNLGNVDQKLKLASFVVDMADVFERYLLNVLRTSERVSEVALGILDGNVEGRRSLFSDSKRYEAKPDIVVVRSGSPVAVLDAKYKTKLHEADRYQIISHALSFGATDAVLIVPEGQSQELEYVGTIGSGDRIRLFVYHFGLESGNLVERENRFVEKMLEICGAGAE